MFSCWTIVIHRMSWERISICVLLISNNKMVSERWNLMIREVDVIDYRDGFNLGSSYREHSRTSGRGWRWWWWLRFAQWKVRYRVRSIDRQLIILYSMEIRIYVNEAEWLSIAADMHTWRDWRRITISFDLSAPLSSRLSRGEKREDYWWIRERAEVGKEGRNNINLCTPGNVMCNTLVTKKAKMRMIS